MAAIWLLQEYEDGTWTTFGSFFYRRQAMTLLDRYQRQGRRVRVIRG